MGIGGILAAKYLSSKETNDPPPEYRTVDTDKATYRLLYEKHDWPPGPEDLAAFPHLKGHFVEAQIRNPDFLFSLDVRDLSRATLKEESEDGDGLTVRDRLVSNVLIEYLAEREVLIAFEHLHLPKEMLSENDAFQSIKMITGLFAATLAAVETHELGRNQKLSR